MINHYFGLLDWQFYFHFCYFLLVSFFAFYIPGFIFFKNIKLNNISKFFLSFVLGIVLWVLQGVVFGYLNFRIGSYFYIFLFLIFFFSNLKENLKFIKLVFGKFKFHFDYFIIILVGFFTQMLAIFSSGLRNKNGIEFYFSNGTDAVMHLTFIKGLVEYFPPIRLDMFAEKLTGYHYFSDFAMAEIARLFGIPIIHLFFHYFPILLFFLTTFLFVQLIKQYKNDDFLTKIALIFFYFSGELAYLFSYYWHQSFGVNVATIDNGADQFLNMPFIFAKLIFIACFYLLKEFLKAKKDKKMGIILIILIGSLTSFKIYWAMFMFLGLGFLTLLEFFKILKKKKNNFLKIFTLSFFSGLFALLIFFSNNSFGGDNGIFWTPMIWPKLLLGADHLDFMDWFLKRQVFESTNNQLRLVLQNIQATTIALLSIYGLRILPFLLLPLLKFKDKSFCLNFLFFPSIIFIFLGLNTTQSPGGFNTFNFFVVTCFVGIFLMIFLLDFLQKKLKSKYLYYFVVFLFILFSIPRPVVQVFRFAKEIKNKKTSFYISQKQLELLHPLSQTNDRNLIQMSIDDKTSKRISYLPFFSHKPSYLTGLDTLDFQGMQWENRFEKLEFIKKIDNLNLKIKEYKALNIHYFYVKDEDSINFWKKEANEYIDIISENESGILIKFR